MYGACEKKIIEPVQIGKIIMENNESGPVQIVKNIMENIKSGPVQIIKIIKENSKSGLVQISNMDLTFSCASQHL